MRADFIARDREERPILVAATKAQMLSSLGMDDALESLKSAKVPVPFGLVADFSKVRIYDMSQAGSPRELLALETDDLLQTYDPKFVGKNASSRERPIFYDYFKTLIEAWLRDVAYRWKSPIPPAIDRLATIGLAPRLDGGDTYDEDPDR
jgi:hypothetical protein